LFVDIRQETGMVFDWDIGNIGKCGKHGVSIAEIEYALLADPIIIPDPYPDEDRRRAIGTNGDGRFVFVVFVSRMVGGELRLRPLSARYMHKKELKKYI